MNGLLTGAGCWLPAVEMVKNAAVETENEKDQVCRIDCSFLSSRVLFRFPPVQEREMKPLPGLTQNKTLTSSFAVQELLNLSLQLKERAITLQNPILVDKQQAGKRRD